MFSTSTMWSAKAKAQSKTNPSPKRVPVGALQRKQGSPQSKAHAYPGKNSIELILFPSMAERNGTMTTEAPVMNPALEAVVNLIPKV